LALAGDAFKSFQEVIGEDVGKLDNTAHSIETQVEHMTNLMLKLNSKLLAADFDRMDEDHDGKVSQDEFIDFMEREEDLPRAASNDDPFHSHVSDETYNNKNPISSTIPSTNTVITFPTTHVNTNVYTNENINNDENNNNNENTNNDKNTQTVEQEKSEDINLNDFDFDFKVKNLLSSE
jgi:hypothetical protein